jgi:hypothetical protein
LTLAVLNQLADFFLGRLFALIELCSHLAHLSSLALFFLR